MCVCGTLCGRMAATTTAATTAKRLIINVVWLLIVAVTPIAAIYLDTVVVAVAVSNTFQNGERCTAVGD